MDIAAKTTGAQQGVLCVCCVLCFQMRVSSRFGIGVCTAVVIMHALAVVAAKRCVELGRMAERRQSNRVLWAVGRRWAAVRQRCGQEQHC